MLTAATVVEILDLVRLVPQAGAAIAAWFRATPDPTPEQVDAMLQEWRVVRGATQASVDEFNKDL